jgi:hypothetical protein
MAGKESDIKWLARRASEYHLAENDMGEIVEGFEDVGKLGHGFTVVDELDEIDLGDRITKRLTYLSKNLTQKQKEGMLLLLKEFVGCFAWEYMEMPSLDRSLVKHRLSIKRGFQPHKQPTWSFSSKIVGQVKEEVGRLLKAGFIQLCRYTEWVSNVVPVEKKGMGKIWVCVDFRDLNRATPKDEYLMPIADLLINNASGNKMIIFMDGNAGYNQIFMAKEDIHKTAFRCSGFIGLFEWVVMMFSLKNAGTTYQRAMNLIFHDLLGVIMDVYINDAVIKLASFDEHVAANNLREDGEIWFEDESA